MSDFVKMDQHDVARVVDMMPDKLRGICQHKGLMLGGGAVRTAMANEPMSDLDFFGPDVITMKAAAHIWAGMSGGNTIETPNAVTVLSKHKPVQFITRWTFPYPIEMLQHFDFTIAQGAVRFYDGVWEGLVSDRFFRDLAAKRLHYTNPPDYEAGATLLRVQKFIKRGYRIDAQQLAKICAAFACQVREVRTVVSQQDLAYMLTGLMKEIDPSAAWETE